MAGEDIGAATVEQPDHITLAWASIDYELQEPPAQVAVATSASGSHVAGESKNAVYAVPCP